jgi:plastocyanin domain-containing protein
MRSALDGAQKPLAEMKQHMNMCMSMMSMMGNMGQNQPRPANPTSPGQAQTARIAVTAKGFEPANINLKPNMPAKVTFVRQTDQTCATSVVIPEYKINRELPLNKPVVVEFTPTKTGEFTFACGMNMLKGKVVVQESR